MSDPIRELRQELLAAAERQLEVATNTSRAGRRLDHPHRKRILLIAATIPVAAAIGLTLTAPWKSSPGLLESARAALTPPAGSILHYRWQVALPSDAECAPDSPHEIWIDQTPPHAYRAVLTDCGNQQIEIGGVLGTKTFLVFVPPDTLDVPDFVFDTPPDPVVALREAIRNGRAHDEGPTRLEGRTVARIRLSCSGSPLCRPSYVYVDPETFFPVQDSIADGFRSWTGERYDLVTRYPVYEYLPATPANRALTDIRAQHPGAVER